MNKPRPVYLNLVKIRLPLPGFISILHRASGFLVFLLIPLFLWMLHASLSSADQFQMLQQCFANGWFRFLVWVLTSALIYHLIAGIRHLIMDIGYGESLAAGRASSYVVLVISLILIIFLGYWLW